MFWGCHVSDYSTYDKYISSLFYNKFQPAGGPSWVIVGCNEFVESDFDKIQIDVPSEVRPCRIVSVAGYGVALLMHQLLDCSSNHTILNYLLCCCLCFHPCGLRTLSRLDLGQNIGQLSNRHTIFCNHKHGCILF